MTDLFNLNDKRIVMKLGSVELRIDATIDFESEYSATVTDHKIEEGADITDHKRIDPVKLTLTGIISNLPTAETFLGTAFDFLVGLVEQNPLSFFSDLAESPSSRVLKQLKDALNNSDPITISETPQGTFENMQIVGMKLPSRADLGGALEFQLSLRELQKVAGASFADVALSVLGDVASLLVPGLGGVLDVGKDLLEGNVLSVTQNVIGGGGLSELVPDFIGIG